jgi:hypothetical protein
MDADNAGVIRLDELLAYFKINKTLLTEQIFEDKGSKYKGFLNFEQFVLFTWQFLTLSVQKVAAFSFHLMDTKKTGFLTQEKVKILIELIHNKSFEESDTIRKLVKKCVLIHGEKLSIGEFEAFSESHRLLCDPLRRTQISYQSKLLGRMNWKRIRLLRESNTSGGYSIEDDVADKMLAKYRLERRLNTSLIELEQRQTALEVVMEAMLDSPADESENVSRREVQVLGTEDHSIIIPPEGKIRVPKSISQRRTPQLIPPSDAPKKHKKKKRRFGRKASTCSGYQKNDLEAAKRRHSLDEQGPSSPAAAMLKDINNVTIFKSSSLDLYDDDNGHDNDIFLANGSGDDHDRDTERKASDESLSSKGLVKAASGKRSKEGSVVPF